VLIERPDLRADRGFRQGDWRGATMSDALSEREQAVLSWLQHGLSNKEIGLALSISPRTVQKHLQRVYQQLGVQTRAEAIVRIHRSARRFSA
jgi:DNA-binding NarL/FixJ family response regulator